MTASLRTMLALGLALGLGTGLVGTEPPQPAKPAAAAPSPERPLKPPDPEPVKPADLEASLRRGVDFLIACQNEDGSLGNHYRTKDLNIYAPVPGSLLAFQSATTALGIAALIEVGDRRPEAQRCLERAENWLFESLPKIRRATPDAIYNVWSHSYGIKALVRMHGRLPSDAQRQAKIIKLIEEQIDRLKRYELVDGGWGYYDFNIGTQRPAGESSSFTTATALIALHEVKKLGVEVPPGLAQRAAASIVRQRKSDFSYLYGEYLKWRPMMGINRPAGSLGRSQACNLALRLWGDPLITDDVLITWLDRLITRNVWLDIARKRPIPHESYFQVAGYFFYYGHYYAGLCVEALPPDRRPFYQDHLARILMPLQEKDGSWWDYPLYNYHQPYGTAYALMMLHRCRKQAGSATQPAPPPKGRPSGAVIKHSHNDYFRPRPLFDALDAGFESVEADVHLVDGQLLIGHDRVQLKPDRTLESLYLAPLRARVAQHGGRVHPGQDRFFLLIDVKSEAETTYQAIDAELRKHPDLFSEFRNGKFTLRAVTVVISGNMARQTILKQQHRFAGFDGREGDVWSDLPVEAMPWVSESWSKLFKWRGDRPMPEDEREKLSKFIGLSHTKGRLVRFWGVPEREDVWQELLDHRVDIIGTDLPRKLSDFLRRDVAGPAQVPPALTLSPNDRVVLLGNTFSERDRHYGWFETTLRRAFPGQPFIVRNFAWPGDTAGTQLRPLNYLPLDTQLAEFKPTVIFVCFGTSEAYGGAEQLERFRADLERYLDRLIKTGAKVVVLTPPRHEQLGPPWPDPAPHNANLEIYTQAMQDVAARKSCRCLDLFTSVITKGPASQPLTDNGIHLSAAGYRRAWEEAARQLGWSLAPLSPERLEALRTEVVRKEGLYFDRHRAHNGEYIYGRRAKAGDGNSGNPSFVNEFAQFEKLLGEADQRIVAASRQ